MPYIFGGDTGVTAQQLQAQRPRPQQTDPYAGLAEGLANLGKIFNPRARPGAAAPLGSTLAPASAPAAFTTMSDAAAAPVDAANGPYGNIARFLVPGKDASHAGFNADFGGALEQFLAASPGITIKSGYRSPARQAVLYKNAVAKYGSPQAARKWVAPPGRSRHGMGVAADLAYPNAQARAWAHQNAARYGLTYPMSWEDWHIEPIGARRR